MYTIQALIPDLGATTIFPDSWEDVYQVPQEDTEQDELQEARREAEMARRFYVNVRIVKDAGDRLQKVVA